MPKSEFFDDRDPGSSLVGWAVKQTVIWAGIGLAVYFVLNSQEAPVGTAPAPPAAPAASPARVGSPHVAEPRNGVRNSLMYVANSQGHVVIDGAVNGGTVRFLVDTGATLVTLSQKDARAAGLDPARLDYAATLNTANGRTRAAPVTLREIRIGQLTLENVPAVVVERLDASLLGMSFLSRLDGWEMRNGVLTLSW